MISFSGRLSRKPFIILSIISGVIAYLNLIAVSYLKNMTPTVGSLAVLLGSIVSIVISIFIIVFSISLHIRRWHDLGSSGWWTLLTIIPIINIGIVIYLWIKKGETNSNKYGPAI